MFDEFDPPEPGIFRGFEPDTFAFLAELRQNNSRDWLLANAARYKNVLREPLRSLFKSLAPVVTRLNPHLETRARFGRVLAGIKKRWPDANGPYHDFLWGAFYRANHTKQTDVQLYVTVRADGLYVGLGTGKGAQDVRDLLHDNVEAHSEVFFRLVLPLLSEGITAYSGDEVSGSLDTPDDIMQLATTAFVKLERFYPRGDELLYRPELSDEISRLFEKLYPLYRFAISDDLSVKVTVTNPPQPQTVETTETLEQLTTETFLPAAFWNRLDTLLRDKGQIVLYGPPGTGKTFIARRFARYFVSQAGGIVQIVQFHPSYAYEDFIEGIRPHSEDGQITYPVEPGIFYRLCEEARHCPERRYVLIIDELNRGSLPRIFGELLYALEYRDEVQSVLLPYSKVSFTIPRNVYLIGTMNTADRSITPLDHALRRRFHFIPLRPDPQILREWLHSQANERMLWVADLMVELNRRLQEDQIDWQAQIGHTYWMVRGLDEARAALIWEHSILPLLEDYFYNRPDWAERYDYQELVAHAISESAHQ